MAERGESFPWEKSETRARTWSDRVRVSQLAVRPAPTPRPYAARRVISGSAMPTQRMSSGISACCQCLINAVTGLVHLTSPPRPAPSYFVRARALPPPLSAVPKYWPLSALSARSVVEGDHAGLRLQLDHRLLSERIPLKLVRVKFPFVLKAQELIFGHHTIRDAEDKRAVLSSVRSANSNPGISQRLHGDAEVFTLSPSGKYAHVTSSGW
jgi:hypothetical protein